MVPAQPPQNTTSQGVQEVDVQVTSQTAYQFSRTTPDRLTILSQFVVFTRSTLLSKYVIEIDIPNAQVVYRDEQLLPHPDLNLLLREAYAFWKGTPDIAVELEAFF